MKSAWIYRITAVIFLIFAAGHTIGFLTFVSPSPEAQAVFASMNSVDLHVPHATGIFTYGGFYRGFGLACTFAMLLNALLCWHLATLASKHPAALGFFPWLFFLCQVAGICATWRYFRPRPFHLFRRRHTTSRSRRLLAPRQPKTAAST